MASGNITLKPISQIHLPPYPTSQEKTPAGWALPIVPNFSDWELGDIVLVEGSGLWGSLISLGQGVLSPSSKSGKSWSHCAIYSGHGNVIDATFGSRIAEQSVATYVTNRAVAVLRLIPDPNTPATPGAAVAALARTRIGDAYAWRDILSIVAKWGNVKPIANGNHTAAYCSALVVQCYGKVNAPLDTVPGGCPCFPSTLSCHPWLQDVSIEWRSPSP
jgi:hypothetical protein